MNGIRHSPEALKLFAKLSDREHAIFEAGIALGAIAHQLVGTPIDREKLREFEELMSRIFLVQPFRKSVKIRIREDRLTPGRVKPYQYSVITLESLDVSVEVEYGDARVVGKMNWIEELGYPLMWIEDVKE